MQNWDHSIQQRILVYQGKELELFCFIFVEVIKKFMGSVSFFGGGHPVENLLSTKPAEFYLRGINTLLYKLQEVIQNNGEYNIDWNQFIVKLLINYILLKGKLFMKPCANKWNPAFRKFYLRNIRSEIFGWMYIPIDRIWH